MKNLKILINLLFIVTALWLVKNVIDLYSYIAFEQYAHTAAIIGYALAVVLLLYSLKMKGYAFSDATAAVGLARNRILSTFDMLKPDVRPEFMRVYGTQGQTFIGMQEAMGYSRGVSRNSTTTYEEEWIHQIIYVGTGGIIADPNYATNGVFSFVLSSASGTNTYLPYSAVAPYTNSASPNFYGIPVQKNDEIRFQENGATALIYDITGLGTNTVTVYCKLFDLTKNITVASYVAGTPLSVISNAWSDGSKQPRGLQYNARKNYSYTKIIKSGYSWDGATATDQLWVKNYYKGKDIIGYQIIGQDNTEYEHLMKIDNALMWSRPNFNNIMDPLTDEPNRSTEGLVPYIERAGNLVPVVPGAFTIGTFETIAGIEERNFAPNDLLWMTGFDIQMEINGVLKEYFQGNSVQQYVQQVTSNVFGGDNGLFGSVNFQGFQYGRYSHSFVNMPMFSNPRYQPAGYKARNMALVVPMGRTKNPKKPSEELPYMGTIYKEMGGQSRKMRIWQINGPTPGPGFAAGNDTPIWEDDLTMLCWLSEVGGEYTGGNRMVKVSAD